jgi:hypothetical protein
LTAALATGRAVLPVSGISAWYTDLGCNHLEGDVEVAEPGTPRGSWCSFVEPAHRWWWLLVVPAVAVSTLVALVYVAVWAFLCVLLAVQDIHVLSLRAYLEL